jgi:hypothetical protein
MEFLSRNFHKVSDYNKNIGSDASKIEWLWYEIGSKIKKSEYILVFTGVSERFFE